MAWGVEVVARGGKGRFVMQLTGTAYAVASARVAAASFTWARIRVCGAGCAELAPADLAEALCFVPAERQLIRAVLRAPHLWDSGLPEVSARARALPPREHVR